MPRYLSSPLLSHLINNQTPTLPRTTYQKLFLQISKSVSYSPILSCFSLLAQGKAFAKAETVQSRTPHRSQQKPPTMSAFETAVADSKKLTSKPSNDDLLELYGMVLLQLRKYPSRGTHIPRGGEYRGEKDRS